MEMMGFWKPGDKPGICNGWEWEPDSSASCSGLVGQCQLVIKGRGAGGNRDGDRHMKGVW